MNTVENPPNPLYKGKMTFPLVKGVRGIFECQKSELLP